jgi:hypothetical protein
MFTVARSVLGFADWVAYRAGIVVAAMEDLP